MAFVFHRRGWKPVLTMEPPPPGVPYAEFVLDDDLTPGAARKMLIWAKTFGPTHEELDDLLLRVHHRTVFWLDHKPTSGGLLSIRQRGAGVAMTGGSNEKLDALQREWDAEVARRGLDPELYVFGQ